MWSGVKHGPDQFRVKLAKRQRGHRRTASSTHHTDAAMPTSVTAPANFQPPRSHAKVMLAPYVGVHWERKLGGTADLAQSQGDEASSIAVLFGIRTWF